MRFYKLFFGMFLLAFAGGVATMAGEDRHGRHASVSSDAPLAVLTRGDRSVIVLWRECWNGRVREVLAADGWKERGVDEVDVHLGTLLCPVIGSGSSWHDSDARFFWVRCLRVDKSGRLRRIFERKNVRVDDLSSLITNQKIARK